MAKKDNTLLTEDELDLEFENAETATKESKVETPKNVTVVGYEVKYDSNGRVVYSGPVYK